MRVRSKKGSRPTGALEHWQFRAADQPDDHCGILCVCLHVRFVHNIDELTCLVVDSQSGSMPLSLARGKGSGLAVRSRRLDIVLCPSLPLAQVLEAFKMGLDSD